MTTYAFTSITASYVPKARVLAASLRRHHPELRLVAAVGEELTEALRAQLAGFDELRSLADYDVTADRGWQFQHTVVETCTALKAFVLADLLADPAADAVLYFDPDVAVFRRLDDLLDRLDDASILLTPHQTAPETEATARHDNDHTILRHGVYNLGFLAVRGTAVGRAFADWWATRLATHCFDEPELGLFTDQRWMDMVPGTFPEVLVDRDPTLNVATWNLSHRRVEGRAPQALTVGGRPLGFAHFTGIDTGAGLTMMHRYAASMPAMFGLYEWYTHAVEQADPEGLAAARWPNARYAGGTPIPLAARRLYRDRPDLRRPGEDPFSDGPGSFADRVASLLPPPPAAEARGSAWADNELVHYVIAGADAGLDPHPTFGSRAYLELHPDVAQAGVNPLEHYVRWGRHEGRRRPPSPAGDEHLRALPLPAAGGDGARTRIVLVGHGHGEVDRAVRAHAASLAATHDVAVLWRPSVGDPDVPGLGTPPSGAFHLLLPSGELRRPRDPAALVRELAAFGPQHVHVHHAYGLEEVLEPALRALAVPFDVTLHDHYTVAPQPLLAGRGGHFLGDPGPANERELRAVSAGPVPASLDAWRDGWRWLLEEAASVQATSGDLAARLERLGAARPLTVPSPGAPAPVRPRARSGAERLRVAVIGRLDAPRGLGVVQDTALLAEARGLHVAFRLLGHVEGVHRPDAVALLEPIDVRRPAPLADAIADLDPHVVWIPSQAPASASLALDLALAGGRPVAASALGVLPERLAERPWSWLLPWDSAPSEWLELFAGFDALCAARAVERPAAAVGV